MVIQLYWERPELISISESGPQTLQITFNNQALFKNTKGKPVHPRYAVEKELPRQIDPLLGETLDAAADAAANTTKFAFTGSFIFQLFFLGGLSTLLGMIQNLNTIVHMQLINVMTPANAQIFFSKLLSIVAFDVINGTPIESSINSLVAKQDAPPLSANFEALGYETSLFVPSMGSLILIYVFFPAFVPVLLLIRKLPHEKVKMKADAILEKTFFNSILSFFEETYLVMTISSFANLLVFYRGSVTGDINFSLALVTLLIIIGFPLFITFVYCCVSTRRIVSEKFKARFGSFYEDLKIRTLDKQNKNYSNSKRRLKWPLCQLIMNLLLACMLVFSIKYPFA